MARTELLFWILPLATIPVLIALGNMELWSGFPLTYTYRSICGLSSCLSIDLVPFWIDSLFYTGLGYGLLLAGAKYHHRGRMA